MNSQPAITVHCPLCAHKVAIPELSHRQRAQCPKCGYVLTRFRNYNPEYIFALSICGLIFLFLSLPYEFLGFAANGQKREINLTAGLETLITLHYTSLAIITGLATLILPGLVMIGLATLSYCRITNAQPSWLVRVYKSVVQLIPWSMAEIFLVGTLVSLVKIADLATIEIGVSFIAFCCFIGAMSFALLFFDRLNYAQWLQLDEHIRYEAVTAKQKSISIQRTWAFLTTATLLYIPANLYPIMHTNLFGNNEPSTIIGGVFTLWQAGSYPIAIIIFFASVVVPVAKLIVLAWLNWSVQFNSIVLKRRRTQLYHITEWIGRWSMIDVFVVAILVALIQLGNTISVYPGHAALAFCAVVFFTMIAAMTFDSRLIWQKGNIAFEHRATQ